MKSLTISVKHVASSKSQPCAACLAGFVPAEDTGSRVLSIKAPEEAPRSTGQVVDLMDALRRSVAEAKERRGDGAAQPAAKKPAAKAPAKQAAKKTAKKATKAATKKTAAKKAGTAKKAVAKKSAARRSA